jgi:FMN phosphatase YigB (HAD superfamily)
MKNRIILFDVDETLFDNSKASVLHKQEILKLLGNPDANEYQKIKDEYKKSLPNEREYDPEVVLKMVCDHFGFTNLSALLDVYYAKENWKIYEDAVFPDVVKTLEILKSDYKLGVYSEGNPKFQTNKFSALNLEKYFDKDLIFILPAKDTKEAVARIPEGSIVIDDKLTICEFLTKNGINTIWLNRKDNSVNPNFTTIYSLLELPGILI